MLAPHSTVKHQEEVGKLNAEIKLLKAYIAELERVCKINHVGTAVLLKGPVDER